MHVLSCASTIAFQSRYRSAHLPDKETEAWRSWLAQDHVGSLTLTLKLFKLPNEEGGIKEEMEGQRARAGRMGQEEGSGE